MTNTRRVQNTQAGGSRDASTVERLLRAMQHMEARLGVRIDTLKAIAVPQTPLPPPPPPFVAVNPPDRRLHADFHKRNPPVFMGTRDPMVAMVWLDRMKKIFRSFLCSEDEQVMLATDMLRNKADTWWESTKSRLAREGVQVTWALFQKRFGGST